MFLFLNKLNIIASLLSMTLSGCAFSSDKNSYDHSNQKTMKTDIDNNHYDFYVFFKNFSKSVKNSEWTQLSEMTNFPFYLKGELDSNEAVTFDEVKFIKSISGVLNEEIYISIEDELQSSKLQKVITDLSSHLILEGNTASLFGVLFEKQDDRWKMTQITTHIHIIEQYNGE